MSTYIYLRHCSVHQQIKGKNDKFNISGERKVMRPAQLTHGFKWFNAKPETQVVFFSCHQQADKLAMTKLT